MAGAERGRKGQSNNSLSSREYEFFMKQHMQSLLTKKKHHRSSKRGGSNNKHLLKPNSNHSKCKTSASIYTIKCQVTENKIILLENTVLTQTSEVKIIFFILLCHICKPTLTSVLISRE